MIFAQGREEGSLAFQGTLEHAARGFFTILQGLQSLCRTKGEVRSFRRVDRVTGISRDSALSQNRTYGSVYGSCFK